MIYLDYAANTPVCKEALDVFIEASVKYIGNPNSNHQLGRESKEKIDMATENIAHMLKIKPEELIYTSGASEANNLAIKGIAGKYKRYGKHMITTYVEHSSLNGAIMGLRDQGFEIDFVNLDEDGRVDLEHLKELMRNDTILVSIAYVDSEIGLVQPVHEIGELIRQYENCHFHVDATQAVGKIPVDFSNVDLVTFTAHKFYGPNGIGALIKKESVDLVPLIEGGLSTTIYRSGTPTVALIASMEVALKRALEKLEEHEQYVTELNEKVKSRLLQYPKVVMNSKPISSPFILNISLKGMKSREFAKALDEANIYVSTKSACCPENAASKPVLCLTNDRKLAMNPLRVSFSHLTTREEVDMFLHTFDDIYNRMA